MNPSGQLFSLPCYFLAGQPLASAGWGGKNNRKNAQEEKKEWRKETLSPTICSRPPPPPHSQSLSLLAQIKVHVEVVFLTNKSQGGVVFKLNLEDIHSSQQSNTNTAMHF